MYLKRLLILLALLFTSLSAQAEYQLYSATLESSAWSARSAKSSCELSHIIPFYGIATFIRRIDDEMVFFVSTNREDARPGKVQIDSLPPGWQSSSEIESLGTTTVSKGRRPLYIKGSVALRLLYELESGMQPAFSYPDWADGKDEVKVVLSTVRFRDGLDEFLACVAALPPYEWDTVRDTQVYFASGSHRLGSLAKSELDRVTQYLRFDPEVKSILLTGHTDSKGTMELNEALAKRRAATVRRYLLDYGVDSSLLRVEYFGERRPVEGNLTPAGRAKNRRVTVELLK